MRRPPHTILVLFIASSTALALGGQPRHGLHRAGSVATPGAEGEGFTLRTEVEMSATSKGEGFSLHESDRKPRARGGDFVVTTARSSSAAGSHCLCGERIFADDFETGDTNRWSSTTR